ncbi:MAG TPA: hypothetical protein VF329_06485 [Gammaproteobacteria bacterium]
MLSSFVDRLDPLIWVIIAGIVLAIVLRRRRTGGRGARGPRPTSWLRLARDAYRPWDHEAALLRLCHGDEEMAERLIRYEIERNPELSRAGAALSAATRLRHDKR